jgi:pyruvate kinase
MRRTKIVATLGPASSDGDAIAQLVAAGVNVFRLNFSHGTRESHAGAIRAVRAAAGDAGRCVAVLQDLSGPKIRTGPLAGAPLTLNKGDTLDIVVGQEPAVPGRVWTTYGQLPASVRPGDTLLLDDGRIQLRVEQSEVDTIRTSVVDGGTLGAHKGINAPGVPLPSVGLTRKDEEDLEFGVSIGVDYVALSFVQSADDLHRAREKLRSLGAAGLPLVAKLERPEAITRIEEVLEASDAVMVARGDLGLELPLEHVPHVQKDVTRRARALGIPVIVATQVLESMRTEPRPTRAEVNDAANAVEDGVDAIMLAGETAIGLHPVRAVQTLDAIVRDAELMPLADAPLRDSAHVLGGHGRALCEAAVTLAIRGGAAAIVALTRAGKTARVLSALRPPVPVIAATNNAGVARRLALAWGVVPVEADLTGDVSDVAHRVGRMLEEQRLVPPSSSVVLVSITPDVAPGPSNVLKFQTV